jgi:hypothetical protein
VATSHRTKWQRRLASEIRQSLKRLQKGLPNSGPPTIATFMSRPCHGFVTTSTQRKPLILLVCHDVTTSRRGAGGKVPGRSWKVPVTSRRWTTTTKPNQTKQKLIKANQSA